jgi:hypothetical protein
MPRYLLAALASCCPGCRCAPAMAIARPRPGFSGCASGRVHCQRLWRPSGAAAFAGAAHGRGPDHAKLCWKRMKEPESGTRGPATNSVTRCATCRGGSGAGPLGHNAGVRRPPARSTRYLLAALAFTLNDAATSNPEKLRRCSGGWLFHSFPSQHTSLAFTSTSLLHKRYGGRSAGTAWGVLGGSNHGGHPG